MSHMSNTPNLGLVTLLVTDNNGDHEQVSGDSRDGCHSQANGEQRQSPRHHDAPRIHVHGAETW